MAGLKGVCPGDVYVHCAQPRGAHPGWEGGWLQLWRLMHSRWGGRGKADRQDWGLNPAHWLASNSSAHLLGWA